MDEGREDWLLCGECRLFRGCMVAGRKKETYGELLSIWPEQGFVVREKPEMCKQYFPGQLMKTYFLTWCRIQICRPHSLHLPQEKTTKKQPHYYHIMSLIISHAFQLVLGTHTPESTGILIRALVQTTDVKTVHMQTLINTTSPRTFRFQKLIYNKIINDNNQM